MRGSWNRKYARWPEYYSDSHAKLASFMEALLAKFGTEANDQECQVVIPCWVELERYAPQENGEIFRKMLFRDWCPSFIEVVLSKMSWSTCSYLSTIQSPGIAHMRAFDEVQLVQVEDDMDRSVCTSERCLYQIDETTYKSQHVMFGCDCAFLHVPDQVWDIVSKNEIALARLDHDQNGIPYLTIEPAQSDSVYLAISHVWSGGLGNVNENALPICQLQRLARHLEAVCSELGLKDQLGITGSILFWMDTLCIPVMKRNNNKATTSQTRQTRSEVRKVLSIIYY